MFKDTLSSILKNNKIKMKDFANSCNISSAQMSQILNGRCSLSLRVFNIILQNIPKADVLPNGDDSNQWELCRAYCEYLAFTNRKVKKDELYWFFNNSKKYFLVTEWTRLIGLVLIRYIDDEKLNGFI